MDWSSVDYLWIIVMFLSDSHSDGTHSLQSIHCWDTDAVTHFYKSVPMKKHPQAIQYVDEFEYIIQYNTIQFYLYSTF